MSLQDRAMRKGFYTRKGQWIGGFPSLIALGFFIGITILSSCSSIDCPLNNRVYTTYKLAGSVLVLEDSLTVSTTKISGEDPVKINLYAHVDSFSIPMSYQGKEDVLFMEIRNTTGTTTLDTVRVEKLDYPHFEAVDCNPSFFHTITNVSYTRHRIDSIVINNANVTYDAKKCHFFIYFKDNRY